MYKLSAVFNEQMLQIQHKSQRLMTTAVFKLFRVFMAKDTVLLAALAAIYYLQYLVNI